MKRTTSLLSVSPTETLLYASSNYNNSPIKKKNKKNNYNHPRQGPNLLYIIVMFIVLGFASSKSKIIQMKNLFSP